MKRPFEAVYLEPREIFFYKLRDVIAEWWGWVLIWLLLSAVMVLFVKISIREDKEKAAHAAAWMSECVQDKKHYECEALWRAGEKHDTTTVIPMPVIVNSR